MYYLDNLRFFALHYGFIIDLLKSTCHVYKAYRIIIVRIEGARFFNIVKSEEV